MFHEDRRIELCCSTERANENSLFQVDGTGRTRMTDAVKVYDELSRGRRWVCVAGDELETNVDIPGVFTSQAISLLLVAVAVVVIARLVLSGEIQELLPMTRRVVLRRAIVPVYSQRQPTFRSVLLSVPVSTRAPPTFSSDRSDSLRPDPYGS
jgi:hypothetical protein